MAKKLQYKKNSKKGLSAVVTTVLLVALSMAAIILVWVFVSNIIKKQISSSESCYGDYDKVKINEQYTCYERISATNYKLRFSLMMGDVQVNKVIVSVYSASAVKSYEMINGTTIPNLVMYSGANPTTIILPGKNSGLTYNATGFSAKIDSVEIAPVIGGNLCEVSDSISGIEDCNLIF